RRSFLCRDEVRKHHSLGARSGNEVEGCCALAGSLLGRWRGGRVRGISPKASAGLILPIDSCHTPLGSDNLKHGSAGSRANDAVDRRSAEIAHRAGRAPSFSRSLGIRFRESRSRPETPTTPSWERNEIKPAPTPLI